MKREILGLKIKQRVTAETKAEQRFMMRREAERKKRIFFNEIVPLKEGGVFDLQIDNLPEMDKVQNKFKLSNIIGGKIC